MFGIVHLGQDCYVRADEIVAVHKLEQDAGQLDDEFSVAVHPMHPVRAIVLLRSGLRVPAYSWTGTVIARWQQEIMSGPA